jgi:hypothetical protein
MKRAQRAAARAPLDPAQGGHFIVWEKEPGLRWEVKGYDREGKMLMHTHHTTQASMMMECMTWRARGARQVG